MLLVSVSFVLRHETTETACAIKWKLLSMDQYVPNETTFLGEFFEALFALIRLELGVNAHMRFEVALSFKDAVTRITFELIWSLWSQWIGDGHLGAVFRAKRHHFTHWTSTLSRKTSFIRTVSSICIWIARPLVIRQRAILTDFMWIFIQFQIFFHLKPGECHHHSEMNARKNGNKSNHRIRMKITKMDHKWSVPATHNLEKVCFELVVNWATRLSDVGQWQFHLTVDSRQHFIHFTFPVIRRHFLCKNKVKFSLKCDFESHNVSIYMNFNLRFWTNYVPINQKNVSLQVRLNIFLILNSDFWLH